MSTPLRVSLRYAEANIQEYWVVDVQGQCIYMIRQVAADGRYDWQRTATVGESIAPLVQPTAIVNIADLFGLTYP